MIKRAIKLYRSYTDTRQQAFEWSVKTAESRLRPWFAMLFLVLVVLTWTTAVYRSTSFERLYNQSGFTPFVFFFAISYFCFYIGSKFIFRPTPEELSDDTSPIALFSASPRKSLRSLISAALSCVHTFIYGLYLVNNDLNFMKVF